MNNKIMLIALALLLIAPASAFLNTKSYDALTNTITIKDWLGLSDYETIKFTSEKYGLTDMEVVQEITAAQAMTSKEAFGKLEFINKGGKDWTDKKISYKVLYEYNEIIKVKENVYGNCTHKADEKNGTKAFNYSCITGTKDVEKEKVTVKDFWDLDKLTAKQKYVVHVTAHKSPTTPATDWIAEYGGLAVKEKAWWNATWSACRDITITTGQTWTNGIAVVNITGLSGTIQGLEIVNSDCLNGGTAINRTIISNSSGSAVVTFLVTGTEPTYSVYYAPTGSYTNSPNATLFFDEFDGAALNTGKWTAIGDGTQTVSSGWYTSGAGSAWNGINTIQNDFIYGLVWADYQATTLNENYQIGFETDIESPYGNGLYFYLNKRALVDPDGTTYLAESAAANLTWGCNTTHVFGKDMETGEYKAITVIEKTGRVYMWEGYAKAFSLDFVRIYPINSWLYSTATNYTIGAEESNEPPGSVTLNAPINYFNTSSTSALFNCSSTAGTGYDLQNISLVLYETSGTSWVYQDLSGTPINNYTYELTFSPLEEGTSKWNCLACDDSNCTYATANRTFIVDITPPKVDVIAPVNNTQIVTWVMPYNITLNATQSDVGVGLSICSWYDFVAPPAIPTLHEYVCNTANATSYASGGWKNVYFRANDTLGNWNINNTNFFINSIIDGTPIYTTPITEDAVTNPITFTINATSITTLNGTIVYNGTTYPTSVSFNSTNGLFSANPMEGGYGTKTFYYNYTINGVNHLTANFTQVKSKLTTIIVTDGGCGDLNLSRYFTFANETNREIIKGVNAQVNLQYGILNSSYTITNASLVGVNNISICINGTLGNYTISYGEIQYQKTLYSDNRHYLFTSIKLTSTAVSETIYMLESGLGTAVQFKFLTTALSAYVNKYAALLRWYPAINEYIKTAMGKTDESGITTMYLVQKDVDYRYAIYEPSGALIKLFSPTRKTCLDNPCTDTEQIDSSAASTWPSIVGIIYNLSFAKLTHVYTFIWSDPSGSTSQMNLQVFKLAGNNEITLCDVVGSGATGAISCDASAYNGTFRADVYRLSSPPMPITSRTDDTTTSIFRGSVMGLFVSLLLFLFIAFFGLYNPQIAILFSIIGLIPAVVLKSIPMGTAIALAVIGVLIYHSIKRVS